MEEDYNFVFDDYLDLVAQYEVAACGIDNDCTIREAEPANEYLGVCEEVVIQNNDDHGIANNGETQAGISSMYFTEVERMVMQQPAEVPFEEEQFMEITTEEVVAEPWNENCAEIVVGSEEYIKLQPSDDVKATEDPYTATRPYPCDFCSRRFRKKAKLKDHMVAHEVDTPHACKEVVIQNNDDHGIANNGETQAGISSMYFTEVERMVMQQPAEVPFEEEQFMEITTEEVVAEPWNENCAEIVVGSEEYIKLQPSDDVKATEDPYTATRPYPCDFCSRRFRKKAKLKDHMVAHEVDTPHACKEVVIQNNDDHGIANNGETQAGISSMYFTEVERMVMQQPAEVPFEEEQFMEITTEEVVVRKRHKSSLKKDKNTKYDQFFSPTSGRSFNRKDSMRSHHRIHIKEKITKERGLCHISNVCGDSFPKALAHADVHQRRWKHRCMICGELCTDDKAVANHIQTKHGNNLPLNTCTMCGRTCKDRPTLLKHSFEHSREKLFGCSECDKTFHIKAHLKRHMNSHRNKPVSCEECGQDFPNGRSLMSHRRSHSSVSGPHFSCRQCGEIFASKNSQIIHTRRHTGERPHGCRFCWKAFADAATLRKHERIHTGERPYVCVLCPGAFNQRVVLRDHIRSQHSRPDPNYIHSMTPYFCAICSVWFVTSQDLIAHLILHCDLNTANQRQSQEEPRKFKPRRKLKPHQLETVSSRGNDEDEEDHLSDTDDEHEYKRKVVEKPKKTPPKPNTSAIENINSIMNSKPNKTNRKMKTKPQVVPSRPKAILTQKTRAPVENTSHGVKVCHKAGTLVTQTQPTELKLATGERMRPRIKNVSYHALQSKKLPVATFPTTIASDTTLQNNYHVQSNVIVDAPPDIATEVMETDMRVPKMTIKVSTISTKNCKKKCHSLKPIIGPGNKVVRVISPKNKKIKENPGPEPEDITLDIIPEPITNTNQETVIDPSHQLHELEELSVQHAHQNIFKCAMCNEVFSDRDQLLLHVLIHI